MLERHDQNVILYKRLSDHNSSTIDYESESQEVKWTIVSRIKRFPHDLAESTFVNYLFSPDLMKYLDFNKA